MCIYGVLVPFILLNQKGVGIINFIWNVGSTVFGILIGMMLFNEKIKKLQWLGIVLGFLSFALILLSDVKN
jgi:drug/metabolite transporter (DMT)-like permease